MKFANRRRAALLPRCFAALHTTPPKKESEMSTACAPHALSQRRRTDGRHRTIHSGTTPTPFSTTSGYGCMKSLAHKPHRWPAAEHLAEVCLRFTQTSSSCSFPSSTCRSPDVPIPLLPASTTPSNFSNPLSPHSICITPASATPAPSF